MMNNQAPVAILSYDRPELLQRLLKSIRGQSVQIDLKNVYLFQDGDSPCLQECVEIFRKIIPEGRVLTSEQNLGIALNFDRAERWMFERLNVDIAYFLEDDLILGKHYVEMLNQLAEFALQDERIAYVAAYGNHRATLDQQKARAREVVPMAHKWGFALTRRQWQRQREIIEPYLEIIRRRPYRERDHQAIKDYFDKLGYSSPGTSQDAAKDVASHVLGTVKLMTFACFARYEGKEGVHMRTADFERAGYADTTVYPEAVSLLKPDSDKIDAWVEQSREAARQTLLKSENHIGDAMKIPSASSEFERICTEIFNGNPYDRFEPTIPNPDLQGWNGLHPALSRIVKERKPKVIVDVGVWKGQSTVTLAKAQIEAAADGIVIAVDSFLGSPEHWTRLRPDVHAALGFRHGRPSFYDTFLSNVVLSDMQNRILPLPQTSENAAQILKKLKVVPDLVHIDAAHEYEPVLRDLEVWWDLLRPGGILIGDDFPWTGVARAVVHFTDRINLPFQVENPKWVIRKP